MTFSISNGHFVSMFAYSNIRSIANRRKFQLRHSLAMITLSSVLLWLRGVTVSKLAPALEASRAGFFV
jgi:hypothetical protein